MMATLTRLRQSKVALAGLCIVIVASGLLAWRVIANAHRLPVHSATQALYLPCDDSGRNSELCHPFRVGGTVVAAPERSPHNNADFEFMLTDGCMDWPVALHGDAASVARVRPGDFVVAQGAISIDGEFHSGTLFTGAEAETLRRDMRPPDVALPRDRCLHSQVMPADPSPAAVNATGG